MGIEHILIFLVTGLVVGFASGLLGLGGGFILTPVQYAVYTSMGLSTDVAVKLSFGTTLAVILPTAVSGAWGHHREGAVIWKTALVMGITASICSFFGATLAAYLPGLALKIAFGVIALAAAVRMLTATSVETEREPENNPWIWTAWAVPIGFLTGVLGVGGGVLAIPVMVLALRLRLHSAVATSLAMMPLTVIGGLIGYILSGLKVPDLPAYSFGYVNLLSWVVLTVSSVGMAQVGAITAHKLRGKHLNYIFIALMFYMGLRMIGVFEWLGWPI